MKFFSKLAALFSSRESEPQLCDWFIVEFDAVTVTIRANPPGRDPWQQSFPWADVVRVCFKAEGPGASDGIYVFTKHRDASYVIPTEANGGLKFLAELGDRHLFPHELAIQAASASEGKLICWPASDSPVGT